MPAPSLPLPAAPPLGNDPQGLICGFTFAPEGAVQELTTLAAAAERLRSLPQGGGFTWLHLNLSHVGVVAWLEAHAGLPPSFFEALSDGSRSTRIERDGATLFAVINDVTFDFTFDASDIATLWVSVAADRVITARLHPLRAVDRLRTAVRRGERLGSSVALLDHLLDDQADELQRIARRTADRLDDIEDALLAGRQHERHSAELARLRRLTVRLQRLLAPEPGALARTLSNPPRWLGEADLQRLLHASEEFSVVLRDVAALQERIKLMQDESATRVSEQNNRSLFTLTMVTVLALPINITTGFFGMNVGGIPFAEYRHGFATLVLLVVVFTAIAGWLAFRRPP